MQLGMMPNQLELVQSSNGPNFQSSSYHKVMIVRSTCARAQKVGRRDQLQS